MAGPLSKALNSPLLSLQEFLYNIDGFYNCGVIMRGMKKWTGSEQYSKRRCTAMWSSVALHTLSVIILLIGLLAATRTGNVAVAGYYSGIILSFGTFLAIVGLNVVENRRPMLVASIIFISLGVISCFFCAIVDGIIAAEYIVRRTREFIVCMLHFVYT
ncbi:transmembrane protein 255B [Silurus asotus]|uniref:Transmembrane protein 255B n=1 Tax=Silurus asotus TaxID=30991 RepID=A0AAD5FV48_SILAS|nr:transmembrane protein 255B [Silurus asotus]